MKQHLRWLLLMMLLTACTDIQLIEAPHTATPESIPNDGSTSASPDSNTESQPTFDLAKEIANMPLLNEGGLAQYRWERRLLLIFAESPDSSLYTQQLQAYTELSYELIDRDMYWFHLFQADSSYLDEGLQPFARLSADFVEELRTVYNADSASFRVVLIGKDGGVKLNMTDVVMPDQLFSLIDAMPMRQREMREGG
ncbi:MAG: DUF4174 domain-containing protein [Chloroflexota bacterium]